MVELQYEIVLEVIRHTADVLCGIADDHLFLGDYLHVGAAIECVKHKTCLVGLGICDTHDCGTFCRGNLRCHVIVGKIHFVKIRTCHLRLM